MARRILLADAAPTPAERAALHALGGVVVAAADTCTHCVIAGAAAAKWSVLQAAARGAWVLSAEYLRVAARTRAWPSEAEYAITRLRM